MIVMMMIIIIIIIIIILILIIPWRSHYLERKKAIFYLNYILYMFTRINTLIKKEKKQQ